MAVLEGKVDAQGSKTEFTKEVRWLTELRKGTLCPDQGRRLFTHQGSISDFFRAN